MKYYFATIITYCGEYEFSDNLLFKTNSDPDQKLHAITNRYYDGAVYDPDENIWHSRNISYAIDGKNEIKEEEYQIMARYISDVSHYAEEQGLVEEISDKTAKE